MSGIAPMILVLQALCLGAFGAKPAEPIADTCTGGGPTAKVTNLDRTPGKPPAAHFSIDLHVRNPLQTPVWLIYDMRQPPTLVNQAMLWQTRDKLPLFIWNFSGDRRARALRIPMQTDIILHGVEMTASRQEGPPPIVFARDVRIAGQAAPSWLGHAGMNPTRGEFDVRLKTLVTKRELQGLEETPIAIDVLCTEPIDGRAAGVGP